MTIDPIQQPNSFTNPPQFAFSPKLYFLILPRLAFISGRIALILQNPLFFTSFFRNFGFAELTMHSAMKRKTSFSFALHSFFRNSALIRARSYFRLGNKNKQDLFCISLDFS